MTTLRHTDIDQYYGKLSPFFPYLSFPHPPIQSRTCCVILSTSFGGKEPYLRRCTIVQLSECLIAEVLRSFLQPQGTCQEICSQPHFIYLSPFSSDWCDTRGKWLLAGNAVRSWRRRHNGIMSFERILQLQRLVKKTRESDACLYSGGREVFGQNVRSMCTPQQKKFG